MTTPEGVEGLLRELAPQVLGALLRRYGQFGDCEDAVQEALLAAALQWPAEGLPENPRGWLITVASRRLTDELRGDSARRQREARAAALLPPEALHALSPDEDRSADEDDTLTLLFLCCHPALSPASQVALTLRAVGGLTTAQIARAFLVPEATMAQRISRAKASIKSAGARFSMPPADEREDRLRVVLHVLYLIFNEGYTASSGPDLQRADLTTEAIRLARDIHRLLPDDGEVAGLLALMLLTDARRPARTQPDGGLVPLAEQGDCGIVVLQGDLVASAPLEQERALGMQDPELVLGHHRFRLVEQAQAEVDVAALGFSPGEAHQQPGADLRHLADRFRGVEQSQS